jgi:hypothetical protein
MARAESVDPAGALRDQGTTWTVPNWRKWWSNAKAFVIRSFSITTLDVQSVKLQSLSV